MPRMLCCDLSDSRFLWTGGDMAWLAGIQSWGKVESRKVPSGRDLCPCYSSSYYFRWKVPGPSLPTPCPNPGPSPALGTLGSDPFSASVSASLPAGAASCDVHGSKWIEVTEQMAVTFGWDLPACVGTSDPGVNACAPPSLPLWSITLGPRPFPRPVQASPQGTGVSCQISRVPGSQRESHILAGSRHASDPIAPGSSFFRKLKAPWSLHFINLMLSLGVIINPIS